MLDHGQSILIPRIFLSPARYRVRLLADHSVIDFFPRRIDKRNAINAGSKIRLFLCRFENVSKSRRAVLFKWIKIKDAERFQAPWMTLTAENNKERANRKVT